MAAEAGSATVETHRLGTETLPSGNHSVMRHEFGDLAKI